MNPTQYTHNCVKETIDGLRDGLSRFSGPSRAAVLYVIEPFDPVHVYDPQHLLQGHEPKFKKLYLNSVEWRKSQIEYDKKTFNNMIVEKNLNLAGLISYGGRSSSVFYQMWFTEHHPDMCAVGPTERWLEQAAFRFSHDIANDPNLYTGISGSFLREYAMHAVRDYLVDEMNMILGWDTQMRIYPILNAILEISRTPEEGAWPKGKLVFVEENKRDKIQFIAKFPRLDRPSLEKTKHIRKLLQSVENSERKLVSNERTVVGITREKIPGFSIEADFRGRYGFLNVNGNPVCSFSDGHFKSTTRKAKLVQVEEILLDSDMDPESANILFKIVRAIVHGAATHKHGCTIVIDLNDSPTWISGQMLEKPLNLQSPGLLELTKSLSKVDGALHIGRDIHLHGFACLLDGPSLPGEDRAHGARYNSALRFTAEHDHIVVVVVSSDQPVSVIQDGAELSAKCDWSPPNRLNKPMLLEQWVAINGT